MWWRRVGRVDHCHLALKASYAVQQRSLLKLSWVFDRQLAEIYHYKNNRQRHGTVRKPRVKGLHAFQDVVGLLLRNTFVAFVSSSL